MIYFLPVILIMTSKQYTSFFNKLEPSLLREGRIDIVKDCDCGES